MSHRMSAVVALGAALILIAQPGFAAEPTLHQVYQAAEVGNYAQAQGMMDQVLRDHPNSAKAHYVEAELLARQGRIAAAKTELDTAQRLEPGLPFSTPGAVQELQARLSAAPPNGMGMATAERNSLPAPGFPWRLAIVGLMLVAAIVFFFRRRSSPVTVIPAAGNMPGAYGAAQPYGYGAAGPISPMGGGTGSSILGSLATGAALGAGMVAGESLIHRMLDGGHAAGGNIVPNDNSWADNSSQYDMGGNDFGVADNSSWDDSSSGGGDDWS